MNKKEPPLASLTEQERDGLLVENNELLRIQIELLKELIECFKKEKDPLSHILLCTNPIPKYPKDDERQLKPIIPPQTK